MWVIDVGCATGTTMSALLAAGFGTVSGVDCSAAMLDVARTKLPEVRPIGTGSRSEHCLADNVA